MSEPWVHSQEGIFGDVSPRRYTKAEVAAAVRLDLSSRDGRGCIWWATGPFWPGEVVNRMERARQEIADCELVSKAMAREWDAWDREVDE